MAEFPGMTHIALTVTDLATSVPWYERLLGSKPVLDEDTGSYHHTVYLLPGGTLLSLHQFPGSGGPNRFDEHRVGLDHLSFGSRTGPSSRHGRRGSTRSGSGTEGSSTPTTLGAVVPRSRQHRPGAVRAARLRSAISQL